MARAPVREIVSPGTGSRSGIAFDFAKAEVGVSSQFLSPTALTPASMRGWKKCFVIVEKKPHRVFRMYVQSTGALLMTAVADLERDRYLISEQEDFPEVHKFGLANNLQAYEGQWVASVERNGKGTPQFKLYSGSCQNCDTRLGRYTCDPKVTTKRSIPSPLRSLTDPTTKTKRQVLCEMTQLSASIEEADVNVRCLRIQVPLVLDDGARVVWCPRNPRGSGKGVSLGCGPGAPSSLKVAGVYEASASSRSPMGEIVGFSTDGSAGLSGISSELESKSPDRPVDFEGPKEDAMTLTNRLPEWNDDIGSLTMKFLGGRVTDSSSKNFLVEWRFGDERKPCLQFGKQEDGRWSCDFKYPMCPVQAFGIMVSSFTWTLKKG